MTENRIYLQRFAMYYGACMGVFWTVKWIAFPLGFSVPFLSLLFIVLTLAVPFLGFRYVRMYRQKACDDSIGFFHAFWFTLLMYLFASLLAAAAHYIYFQYIDGGYIADSYTAVWENLLREMPELEPNRDVMDQMIDTLYQISPASWTFSLLTWDLIWGIILALPTALVVARKPVSVYKKD